MNESVSRRAILSAVSYLLLTFGLIWSYSVRLGAQNRSTIEQSKLADCELLAKKIAKLRQRKQRALLQTKPADELNRKIDSWAKQASLRSTQIVRIQPREPRRVGDTHYLEQVTELELQEAALPKLIQLCQLAEQNGDGLKLSSFRLSPSRISATADDAEETWTAELELTYLIYSPRSG